MVKKQTNISHMLLKYHVRNQRTRLPYIAVENMSLRLFWNFNIFLFTLYSYEQN